MHVFGRMYANLIVIQTDVQATFTNLNLDGLFSGKREAATMILLLVRRCYDTSFQSCNSGGTMVPHDR